MKDDPLQRTLKTDGHPLQKIDWTFKKSETQYLTHGLHKYPARMVPAIPRNLIDYFLEEGDISKGDTLYDPFVGSGTSTVEANLAGLNVVANDINPLAVLLTQAKTTPISLQSLSDAIDDLRNQLEEELRDIRNRYVETGEVDIELPDVKEGWFPQPQLYQLTHVRNRIDSLSTKYSSRILRFLKVCLSGTVRKSSYQRNGEFKRYRLSEEDRKSHEPNILERFNDIIEANRKKISEYSEEVDHSLSSHITQFDSRFVSEMSAFENRKADIVITSPPYGDHQTTVAYGQFSTNPIVVVEDAGFSEVFDVDKKGLGGKHNYDNSIEGLEQKSESLQKTLSKLREEEGRSSDAFQFFSDYYDVLFETGKVTKSGQPVVWVVANRTMSGISIPMQLITQELCEELDYETEVILSRGIRNKTLPYQNSPTGKSGSKGELMANESLVVTRAP